jgi:hypothetical protein
VVEMGVDATVGKKTDQVKFRVWSFGFWVAEFGKKVEQDGVLEEVAVADGFVDACDVLINNASGPEIEVADFGITHLPAGQADVLATAAEFTHGIGGVEVVVERGFGQKRGVALFFGSGTAVRADTPAVADDEDDRFFFHGGLVKTMKRTGSG